MTRKLFGTDGIRGRANDTPMTAEIALKVAMASAAVLRRGEHRHRVVIGKDTRLSGYLFEPALAAGFVSMGFDVTMVGPLPTPAVAMLTRSYRADLGVMISASHNPFEDNGIKLFGADGYKLSDAIEMEIESKIESGAHGELAHAKQLGRAQRLDDAPGRYAEYVKSSFPKGRSLEGLKIVIDCANGAAYKVAPRVLFELGAEVIPVAVNPNGTNINEKCGAVAPEAMQEAVVLHGADLGIALDGDADRLILADERGRRIDGDQIMALIATCWADAGLLTGGGVVATVMSNLGLERHLQKRGLNLVRTAVGDRYVVERMRADGFNIGGEQSGHLVLSDYATTGDGLLASLQVLAAIVAQEKKASEVLHVFDTVPQVLKNVRFDGTPPLERADVKGAIAEVEALLNGRGRVLVRKSGTEKLIRVMAEGDDRSTVESAVDRICDVIRAGDAPAASAA
ncbi:phosphoglucosamine mutase [Roseiterribacter gracilis]|uniref:Phosphoglucosamine mutase n=1 Tax=Roseiterribacter gracilis TaxID=2812848 RepID=A0A8S8XGB7_9PROT|nr:phosphoglucosamine mutase [Rhodospirillales bacterium TMPK1]